MRPRGATPGGQRRTQADAGRSARIAGTLAVSGKHRPFGWKISLTERAVVHVTGQLYPSVHTVKTHIRHVYTKLGAHGRREAIERARAHGLLRATS